jgi:hypothetical protein
MAPHREAVLVSVLPGFRKVPNREAVLVLVHPEMRLAPHREAVPPSGRLVGYTE